ncbi:PEP-CTERM sorting domain-containing protein [Neptunomonas qingdaonensis]|uniref:PEP-CTERM protein-sorting domain-containing protein n=1 Tax=Neptunomonas qingdaonensis TaxID=1045558 RepID=A0A1I2UTM0_9GAMM|nr:PEP-CTERM sorting domain-containing protein [Neptunomonas qingdaonensis]SFG80485.1 PEP-CTERM protein-sorting domain-containing protein [Neptunomonas qingdaonensis]
MKKLALAAVIGSVIAAAPAQAAVMWDFNYNDAAGVGFNDAALGTARQGALETAANYVSSFLTSYDATIEMDVDGSIGGGGSSTLAAAGSKFNGASFAPGFTQQGDVMTKILGGADPTPSSGPDSADGEVTWNFIDFVWELDNDFQLGEFDFFSTAVHELLHAIGFASEITETGSDGYGTNPGDAGAWAPFDEFLTSFDGTSIINPADNSLLQSTWDLARLSGDGSQQSGCGAGLQFTGANAVAANGGNTVEIYSPTTWEGGSSGSHLDDNCYTNPGNVSTYMMEAQTIDGLGVRTISALEVGIMRDIGYTNFGVQANNTVPEPGTIYLMLGALLGLFGLKRQNSKVA